MRRLAHAGALAAAALFAGPAHAQDASNGARVAVPAHDIERGDVITQDDLVVQTVAADRIRPGIVTAAANLTGHEARRLLRAGEPIRADDIRMPILVAKGSTVTMTFSAPGIVLTATGRAMTDAGMGETVIVQNPASLRQVSCIVTGAGAVRAAEATSAPQAVANP